MRLFGLGGTAGESDDAKRRRVESEQSLAQGGLPLNAVDRLRRQAETQGTPAHVFTSDLSVNEFALVREAGFNALGQIMGSTVYHVGWQRMPNWSGRSGELGVITQAYYNARHLALRRLQQEAELLGASGVVGVRLDRKTYEWGAGLLEFAAVGTAIREDDVEPALASGKSPFLSDLSGEEFWLLREFGFRPVGFCVGNCSYYQVPTWSTQRRTTGGFFGGGWSNAELPDYTQAVYNSRALAMTRMELEARSVDASGVVGADVHMEAEPREVDTGNDTHRTDMIYHFTATGTAIAPHPIPTPSPSILSTLTLL